MAQTDPTQSPAAKKVLVVDPTAETQAGLARILKAAQFEVVCVASAEAAMARVVDWAPDAFFIDVALPDEDGINLCQRLREDSRFAMRPMLVTTDSEDRAILRRAFAAGADDFVNKPPEPLVVTARLNSLLQKYGNLRKLERVRKNLARYISPRIRQLLETQTDFEYLSQPEEITACVMFSDIRGFTALSHQMAPADLFHQVSEHLGLQVDAVYRNRGYVDKFGGDGVMAIFDGDSMARDACYCAIDIMEATARLAARQGKQPMPLGIGLHMGSVVAGNIGSGEHLDYSVIGNTVNLAARLCGYAHSQDIVVSQAVRDAVAEDAYLRFSDPREASIRGLPKPIRLFRLLPVEANSVKRNLS